MNSLDCKRNNEQSKTSSKLLQRMTKILDSKMHLHYIRALRFQPNLYLSDALQMVLQSTCDHKSMKTFVIKEIREIDLAPNAIPRPNRTASKRVTHCERVRKLLQLELFIIPQIKANAEKMWPHGVRSEIKSIIIPMNRYECDMIKPNDVAPTQV